MSRTQLPWVPHTTRISVLFVTGNDRASKHSWVFFPGTVRDASTVIFDDGETITGFDPRQETFVLWPGAADTVLSDKIVRNRYRLPASLDGHRPAPGAFIWAGDTLALPGTEASSEAGFLRMRCVRVHSANEQHIVFEDGTSLTQRALFEKPFAYVANQPVDKRVVICIPSQYTSGQ
jgi:hypothetical protein